MALTGLATSAYRFDLSDLIVALGSRSGGAKTRVSYLAGVGHRRRPGRGGDGSGVEVRGAPVVLVLGEGHDGVRDETTKPMAKGHPRFSPGMATELERRGGGGGDLRVDQAPLKSLRYKI